MTKIDQDQIRMGTRVSAETLDALLAMPKIDPVAIVARVFELATLPEEQARAECARARNNVGTEYLNPYGGVVVKVRLGHALGPRERMALAAVDLAESLLDMPAPLRAAIVTLHREGRKDGSL